MNTTCQPGYYLEDGSNACKTCDSLCGTDAEKCKGIASCAGYSLLSNDNDTIVTPDMTTIHNNGTVPYEATPVLGIAIGCAIAGLLLIIVIILAVVCLVRRARRKKKADFDVHGKELKDKSKSSKDKADDKKDEEEQSGLMHDKDKD